jgi:hypothetical protein
MATPAYSLREVQERVKELGDIYAARAQAALAKGQVEDIAATLIRRADDLLACLSAMVDEETCSVSMVRVLTQTLRMTAFLLMQEIASDQAWYWTAENQARIREADQVLTPELRAEVLAEAAADYAALAEDDVALIESQAEDALWESTVGDGLGAD